LKRRLQKFIHSFPAFSVHRKFRGSSRGAARKAVASTVSSQQPEVPLTAWFSPSFFFS
jgi:hypothetical protein